MIDTSFATVNGVGLYYIGCRMFANIIDASSRVVVCCLSLCALPSNFIYFILLPNLGIIIKFANTYWLGFELVTLNFLTPSLTHPFAPLALPCPSLLSPRSNNVQLRGRLQVLALDAAIQQNTVRVLQNSICVTSQCQSYQDDLKPWAQASSSHASNAVAK